MNHSDKAEQLFREGYNCSQAVFGAFSDLTGIEKEYAIKMSASFGGGFGRLREVCGAACGMILAESCLFGYTEPKNQQVKKDNYALVQDMMKEFSGEMGSYICREILGDLAGEKTAEPTPRNEEFYTKRPCIRCIRTAAAILEKVAEEENQ